MHTHSTLPFPPLQVRGGVLVVDGYGLSISVCYGRLVIEDGIADRRRRLTLDRAGNGLERLVLLGWEGSLTLEALRWLRNVGAALVAIGRDGELLAHTVPFGYGGLPIRRAQALATTNGLDVDIAREMIEQKLDGQRAVLERLGAKERAATVARYRDSLSRASSIDNIRLCEAQAGAVYWESWSNVAIRFAPRDLVRIPPRWTRFGGRASLVTGTNRGASTPINACINYLAALLESETRLAILAAGMDPTLGVLHLDAPNRDSFALDALEPLRPIMEGYVLDLLERRTFSARDFVEMQNGVCRIRAPLSHDLATSLGHWRLKVGPVVARLATIFRTAHVASRASTARERTGRERDQPVRLPGFLRRPLVDSVEPQIARPYVKVSASIPLLPPTCPGCGATIDAEARRRAPRRRFCPRCLREFDRSKKAKAAREAVALARLAGNDPAHGGDAAKRRGAHNAAHHKQNSAFGRRATEDERAAFMREITPKLDALSLKTLSEATGLTMAYCSQVRRGRVVPHRRHWLAFRQLIRR